MANKHEIKGYLYVDKLSIAQRHANIMQLVIEAKQFSGGGGPC